MIFVALGTQKQQFSRLFEYIQNSKELLNEKIVAQSGNTEFETKKIEMIPTMSQEEMDKYIDEAEFVICHGGVGTIFTALKKGKKIIAIPRLLKNKEHKDDHQVEICIQLEKEGYILYLREDEKLDDVVKKVRNTNFLKYESNNDFLDVLRKEI